jgi:hypothetical protein
MKLTNLTTYFFAGNHAFDVFIPLLSINLFSVLPAHTIPFSGVPGTLLSIPPLLNNI